MSERIWTAAQMAAIHTHGTNLLVSAAAGSGKTAVLVERVICMITREEEPVDIDRLVIMTFTKAAAAEMKQRIHRALKERLEQHPENVHLRRQLMKVQGARISTIDSLCGELVRDHIQDVDLDPGFRIGEEGELRLLKQEVLQTLLEKKYQEGTEDFLQLVDYYMERNDQELERVILDFYEASESHPEPRAWLKAGAYPYLEAKTLYSGEEQYSYPRGMESWLPAFGSMAMALLREAERLAEKGLEISLRNHGPYKFEALFQEILDFIQEQEDDFFDNRAEGLEQFLRDWKKSPARGKDDEIDPELQKQAVDLRKEIKEVLKDLQDRFLKGSMDEVFGEMAECAPLAVTLSDLTIQFARELEKTKNERQLADFSDIAHYALKVLMRYNLRGEIMRDEKGQPVYTEAADLLAKGIEEVIVDEYQDTNMLQEYLVQALSSERFGRPNVFMVGDIKQSIYRFRMACPELFREKMDSYREMDLEHPEKIDPSALGYLIRLDRNFRSRREVLDFTNYVFEQAMVRELGGIDYLQGHELVYGQGDPETTPVLEEFLPELYFIDAKGEEGKFLEGYEIARRIEALSGRYSYSDIAILTQKNDNPQLEQVLSQRGIPVLKSSGKGFFDCFEIRLFLDLLAIIDNPYQDIPFAAVLYSPLCGADANTLAGIRLAGKEEDSLYECLQNVPEYQDFLLQLEGFRERTAYFGIYDFMNLVLEETGLQRILLAMPGGKERLANIHFLKEKAQGFARGSYVGLDAFLRYIRNLQKAGQDFPRPGASADSVNAVQLMTIHKSKGLEFKVVILAGCGSLFNTSDLKGSLLTSRKFGLGMEYRNSKERIKKKTALLQTIRQENQEELRAEALRLLYVALTRAEEKLIITGIVSGLEKKQTAWEQRKKGSALSSSEILECNHFLELLGRCLYPGNDRDGRYQMSLMEGIEIEEERLTEVLDNRELKLQFEAFAKTCRMETEEITGRLSYQYPYQKASLMQGKITASQLEKREKTEADMETASEYQVDLRYEQQEDSEKRKLLKGAERGNAYHRFLELFDYDAFAVSTRDTSEIRRQIKEQEEGHLLEGAYAEAIEESRILQFLNSSLGQRMQKAALRKQLFREQQFVMGYERDVNREETLTGGRVLSDLPDPELLLVQGIIDAWFIEADEQGREQIILVDYKTDRVRQEEHYVNTYHPQLKAYADVLQRSQKKEVKECLVYSLELGREIPV